MFRTALAQVTTNSSRRRNRRSPLIESLEERWQPNSLVGLSGGQPRPGVYPMLPLRSVSPGFHGRQRTRSPTVQFSVGSLVMKLACESETRPSSDLASTLPKKTATAPRAMKIDTGAAEADNTDFPIKRADAVQNKPKAGPRSAGAPIIQGPRSHGAAVGRSQRPTLNDPLASAKNDSGDTRLYGHERRGCEAPSRIEQRATAANPTPTATASVLATGTSAVGPGGLIGYAPAQVNSRHYGFNQVMFLNQSGQAVSGNGVGETIAIIDPGYDPDALNDLQQFDANVESPAIANPPSFVQVNEYGQTSNYPTNKNIEFEEALSEETSLDIEWAHAMAPAPRSSW